MERIVKRKIIPSPIDSEFVLEEEAYRLILHVIKASKMDIILYTPNFIGCHIHHHYGMAKLMNNIIVRDNLHHGELIYVNTAITTSDKMKEWIYKHPFNQELKTAVIDYAKRILNDRGVDDYIIITDDGVYRNKFKRKIANEFINDFYTYDGRGTDVQIKWEEKYLEKLAKQKMVPPSTPEHKKVLVESYTSGDIQTTNPDDHELEEEEDLTETEDYERQLTEVEKFNLEKWGVIDISQLDEDD